MKCIDVVQYWPLRRIKLWAFLVRVMCYSFTCSQLVVFV